MRWKVVGAALALLLCCASLSAQQTTGNISGRILDPQGAAVPGVTITGRNPETGFVRAEVSDAEGVYQLGALPVGIYEVTAELRGFTTVIDKGIVVNIAQTRTIDFSLKVDGVAETITVVGAPLDRQDVVVGRPGGRSAAHREPAAERTAAREPRSDRARASASDFTPIPRRGRNYAPYINGGAGRNINYLIDGGDNNDDTVGGLLQQFPLEAIQEFNFQTARFKAEYGRSDGGVMNIVTKSGTNRYQGSFFELFRDKSMNALTETEKLAALSTGTSPIKGDYRRNQFGGSFGGPIVMDRVHFFLAIERTQQDTTQTMGTAVTSLFPGVAASAPVLYRENLGTGKIAANLNPNQFLTVRYGRNNNSFPFGGERPEHAGQLGRRDEHVQFDQRQPQLGAPRFPAERIHLSVLGLRERDRRPHRRAEPELPERRGDRRQPERPADDAAAQVPVPRRLLVASDRARRARPRFQDGRERHQRAVALHHERRGKGCPDLYDGQQRSERTGPLGHG